MCRSKTHPKICIPTSWYLDTKCSIFCLNIIIVRHEVLVLSNNNYSTPDVQSEYEQPWKQIEGCVEISPIPIVTSVSRLHRGRHSIVQLSQAFAELKIRGIRWTGDSVSIFPHARLGSAAAIIVWDGILGGGKVPGSPYLGYWSRAPEIVVRQFSIMCQCSSF